MDPATLRGGWKDPRASYLDDRYRQMATENSQLKRKVRDLDDLYRETAIENSHLKRKVRDLEDALDGKDNDYIKEMVTRMQSDVRVRGLERKIRDIQDEISALKEVSQDKEDEAKCIVCVSRPRQLIFPCGHFTMCETCVSKLTKKRCPSCRKAFNKKTLKTVYI
jgi:E3 ubiquitin-protein ligase BRE1